MDKKTTIGIIGMGRMGQAIAAVAEGIEGMAVRPISRLAPADPAPLAGCDAVIEFTIPEAAPGIIRQCLEAGTPIVSGTTGWHEAHLATITQVRQQCGGKFLHATNFSVGMNIVFALNRRLAALMAQYPDFVPSIREVHHVHKKDMPSGTAYSLMEGIFEHHPHYDRFRLNPSDQPASDAELDVTAIREGEVKGYHEVNWRNAGERLFIGHEAFDRSIFAEGALLAAQWLIRQPPGLYTMRDIIRL
jgi:4-hydroxy-tetrahydrodipicolinate reductase